MHLTVANDKGGVAKTTAVCLATYLAKRGKTLLIDKDQTNASATAWGESGKMPFTILSWEQGIYQARNFEHAQSRGLPQSRRTSGGPPRRGS